MLALTRFEKPYRAEKFANIGLTELLKSSVLVIA